MHKFPEEVPTEDQLVLAYTEHSVYIAKFTKYLTWKGYKLRFVNILGNNFAINHIVGWNRLPTRRETL